MEYLRTYESDTEDSESKASEEKVEVCESPTILPLPEVFHNKELKKVEVDSLGRIRTFGHVPGNWATHVYVEVPISENLYDFFEQTVIRMSAHTNIKTHLIPAPHISLSKTVVLQYHEISTFIDLLGKELASNRNVHQNFLCRAENFKCFLNDTASRGFAAVALTAKSKFMGLFDAVDKVFEKFGLEKYYKDPIAHFSFAWWTFSEKGSKNDNLKILRDNELLLNNDYKDFIERYNLMINGVSCKVGNRTYQIKF